MILCSGCFDGIHAGHVAYLAAAKAMGRSDESLVVAVAPDSYIRAAKQREPYWPEDQRARAVSALKGVDEAVVGTGEALIAARTPRLFIVGWDWARKGLPETLLGFCGLLGVAVMFVPTEGRHVAEARG